jgi:hypothetical protein
MKWLSISIGLFRRRNMERGSPADARAHCHLETGGFIGEEGYGIGWRGGIIAYPLSVAGDSQETLSMFWYRY